MATLGFRRRTAASDPRFWRRERRIRIIKSKSWFPFFGGYSVCGSIASTVSFALFAEFVHMCDVGGNGLMHVWALVRQAVVLAADLAELGVQGGVMAERD